METSESHHDPKKEGMSSDPEKFRPICLTSCLSKLDKRLIKTRLYSFLESNNLISSQQSGFRNNRGAADNFLFFTQKISEALVFSLTSLRHLIRCGIKG